MPAPENSRTDVKFCGAELLFKTREKLEGN